MKLKSLSITNVKSFRDETTIEFSEDFNIIIGPNGSGKSNLLDILMVVIRKFFVKGYGIAESKNSFGGFDKTIFIKEIDLNQHLKKFYESRADSFIKITFIVSEYDIENMRTIKNNISQYRTAAKKYKNGDKFFPEIESWDLEQIVENQELTYEIKNNNIVNSTQTAKKLFLQYLNYFEGIIVLSKELTDIKLYPCCLYFSPYRSINFDTQQVNLSSENFYGKIQSILKATSKESFSLIELVFIYFAEKRRNFEEEASESGYKDKWNEDDEVKLISEYLKLLDFNWDLKLINNKKNVYEFLLIKNKRNFRLSEASSGEIEMINFILGIFAFNIKYGLIVIDEPELHMHPKWQNVLLDLFIELSKSTKNQFIISTHSSTFINEKTYSHIIRIYKDIQDKASHFVTLKDTEKIRIKDILHIVNATNNEKIFFSDIVILVEGITDRLVFQKICAELIEERRITEIIEIIDVNGKTNLEKYRAFLGQFEIPNYFIADFDYLTECSNDEIRSLFVGNENKIERDKIDECIDGLVEKKIFILKHGEIEYYFLDGYKQKSVDNAITLLEGGNYEEWKKTDKFFELKEIIIKILEKSGIIQNNAENP
jgi:predicted ATP-dependent endonuclease of OLD family